MPAIAQRSKNQPNPVQGKRRRWTPWDSGLPRHGESQGCHLDLDDGWKQGSEKVGVLSKLLANKEATEMGLEPDDKANVGLPEQLAAMGSGDRGND